MHNSKRPINKIKSNLNQDIVNYYYKYGQNRNLEKYLRLKSSSEGSVSTPESTTKIVIGSPVEHSNKDTKKLNDKRTKSNNKIEKESYSFNCESNIAITMPCSSMPNLSPKGAESATKAAQTDFDSIKSEENATALTQEGDNETPTKDEQQSILKTPESLLKSSSKRLEWDSLADVGYEKTKATNNKSSSLSTLERSVLKDFFADKGIEINFPNNNTKRDNNRLPKISEESNIKTKSISQGAIPKLKQKEKWRETLENVQKKYRSLPALIESNATGTDLSQFKNISGNHHSTPKIYSVEKSCQTSLLRKDTQEIQCNFSNSGSVRSAFEVGSMTSQSSFEYIPQVVESDASCSNKENISPRTPQNDTIEQKLRKSVTKLFELQKMQSINKKYYNEIDLGIQLLCALIESKKMSDEQKTNLAKQIVGRITKTTQSCENPSSDMTSTNTKSASISSLFSTSSLLDKYMTNKNKNDDLVMSGVESISSNKSVVMSGVRSISTNKSSEKFKSKNESVSQRNSVPKFDKIKQSLQPKNNLNNNKTACKMEDKSNQVNTDSLAKGMKKLAISTKVIDIPTEPDCASAAETATTKSETTDDQETMREWLDPLTHSEIKYEDMQKRKCIKKTDIGGSGDFNPSTNESKTLLKIVEKEKKVHFDWIEMEIKRLEQLKLCLVNEEKCNVNSLTNFIPAKEQNQNVDIYPVVFSNNKKYDITAEFSKRNSSESSCKSLAKSSDESSVKSKKTDSQKSFNTEKSNDIEEINIDVIIYTENDNDNVIYNDTVGTNKKSRKLMKKDINNKKKSECSNQGRKAIQSFRKHRSKLETPQNIDSIRSFARQKKLDFIKGYKRAHSRDYDCPAETDHYSEPRNDNTKQLFTNNKPFTSGSSSNLFISSDSISIPITSGAESSSMTTTHQYDSHCGIGIQTTDSILDTCPINNIQCPRKPTQRIYLIGKDQQIQVKPLTISYVLKFDNENKKVDGKDLDNDNKPIMYTENVESLTLAECFKKSRPKFYSNVLERQQILRNMQEFRQTREEKIRDIVENTSIRSIARKLEQLPPPATKFTRIFSTKEMKAMTKRKQVKLPEVLKKVEQQKNDRKKKGNQILRDVFNKRLQRRVHKGKLSLEHSQTVI